LVNYRIERFVSAVEIVDRIREKNAILFFFGDKKGNMIVVRNLGDRFDSLFVEGVHAALISTIRVNVGKLGEAEAKAEEISKQKKHDEAQEIKHKEKGFETPVKGGFDALVPGSQDLILPENLPRQGFGGAYHKDDLILASGSYDRSIKILIFKNAFQKTQLSQSSLTVFLTLKHKYRISEMDWDPFDNDRLLNTCQKHVTVQVWTINPVKPVDPKPAKPTDNDDDKYCLANIRGHKGFITAALWSRNDRNCIITCSDDQSIKIWNLVNIRNQKPPNKKKKDPKAGTMIHEQDDEDDSEDEPAPKQPQEKFKAPRRRYQDDEFEEDEGEEPEFQTPTKRG
jgi:hypothetical protein